MQGGNSGLPRLLPASTRGSAEGDTKVAQIRRGATAECEWNRESSVGESRSKSKNFSLNGHTDSFAPHLGVLPLHEAQKAGYQREQAEGPASRNWCPSIADGVEPEQE